MIKHPTNKLSFAGSLSIPKAIRKILLDDGEKATTFIKPFLLYQKSAVYQKAGSPKMARWRYNQAIRSLEKYDHIKIFKRAGKFFIQLTRRGKLQALLDKIANDQKKGVWDGKWRMIIWDIPESSSKERDKIRYFLKKLGFQKLQLSVFIRPYPIPRPAVDYLRESGLIQFIRFLRIDKVDDPHKLLKHYNLLNRLNK